MQRKFVFDLEHFLNKTVLFETSKVNLEKIIDTVLKNIPGDNNNILLVHEQGTNAFSLRCEDGM